MNVLILDMIHGGEILAEEYLQRGNNVHCVDVYRIAKDEVKDSLKEMGVRTYDEAPPGHYDLLLMPVHCPDKFLENVTYDERKTFHEAVGDLSDGRSRIEVTGVKGKTSCCYLLAHILSLDGRKVFLHTSRGQGEWKSGKHEIERKVSIAPPSILRLPEGYDTTISEVSLGGSGKADITLITNLVEDYGIAANTRKASDAKASIFSKGINIVPRSEIPIWEKYGSKLTPYGGRTKTLEGSSIGRPTRMMIEYDGSHEVELSGEYLHLQYIDTFEAVLEVCHSLEIPASQVIEGIETFKGVPGRGEVRYSNEKWEIVDRNPGISHMSVAKTIDTLEHMNVLKDTLFILDPVNRKVCEKMDTEQIRRMIEEKGANFHLTGENRTEAFDNGVIVRLIKEGYQ